MRKLIKGAAIAFIVLLIAIIALVIERLQPPPSTPEQKLFFAKLNQAIDRHQKQIRLSEFTNFEWDEVYITSPYSACPRYVPKEIVSNVEEYLVASLKRVDGYVELHKDNTIQLFLPWCGGTRHDENTASFLFIENDRITNIFNWNIFKIGLDKSIYGSHDDSLILETEFNDGKIRLKK